MANVVVELELSTEIGDSGHNGLHVESPVVKAAALDHDHAIVQHLQMAEENVWKATVRHVHHLKTSLDIVYQLQRVQCQSTVTGGLGHSALVPSAVGAVLNSNLDIVTLLRPRMVVWTV
jgi:hypothetical protein